MADLIDRIELMRQIAEFGREIPKDQVMSVIARVPTTESTENEVRLLKLKGAINVAADAVNDAARVIETIEALPSADRPKGECLLGTEMSLSKWIPVSEKPKDEKKTYLVQLDGGGMCSCRWTNTNQFWTDLTTDWHWCIFDIPQYCKVVAWMDLEPYKGGEDE